MFYLKGIADNQTSGYRRRFKLQSEISRIGLVHLAADRPDVIRSGHSKFLLQSDAFTTGTPFLLNQKKSF